MAPANADAKEARQLVNKRHALKRKLTRMEESEAAAAAENLPTPEDLPWAQTKGGPMAPLARNTVPDVLVSCANNDPSPVPPTERN